MEFSFCSIIATMMVCISIGKSIATNMVQDFEFFNALNQVNFGNPNQTASSAAFGRITSASSGRVIQLALKLIW